MSWILDRIGQPCACKVFICLLNDAAGKFGSFQTLAAGAIIALNAAFPKLMAIGGQMTFDYTAFPVDIHVACSTEQPPGVCNQNLTGKLLGLTDTMLEAPDASRDLSLSLSPVFLLCVSKPVRTRGRWRKISAS